MGKLVFLQLKLKFLIIKTFCHWESTAKFHTYYTFHVFILKPF